MRQTVGPLSDRRASGPREHQQILDAVAERDAGMAEMPVCRHIRAALAGALERMDTAARRAAEASA